LKEFLQRLVDLEATYALGILTASEFTQAKARENKTTPNGLKWNPKMTPLPKKTNNVMTAAELGSEHTHKTCPLTSTKPKTVKARNRRYEKRCGDVAAELHGNQSPLADQFLSAFMVTNEAKRRFPQTSASLVNDPHLLNLMQNVQDTIVRVGKHAGRFIIRLLTEGLPTWFLKKELGMTDKDVDKRRVDNIDQSDLCKQDYAHGVSRSKVTAVEDSLVERFFFKSSAVFSGTERRCVELSMHEWECKVKHTPRDHNQPSITRNPRSHISRSQSTLDHNQPSEHNIITSHYIVH
jgi:hypothetical protein